MFKKYRILLSVCFVAFLTSCSTTPPKSPGVPGKKPSYTASSPSKPYTPVHDYYKNDRSMQCVPYAREASGIPIRGNAHTWWTQAQGKYECSKTKPKVGAVVVLSKTKRNKYGHVGVVSGIIDNRNIEVEHTNWGGSVATRRIVYKRMPAIDVSENNDWSKIRFWNYPSSSFGRIYPASGFIYPDKPVASKKSASMNE